MKFYICATSIWGNDPDGVLERYPCLKDFGWEIIERTTVKNMRIKDENGDMIYFNDGSFNTIREGFINIHSLEELKALGKACRVPLIVDNDGVRDFIEIYNDWRE